MKVMFSEKLKVDFLVDVDVWSGDIFQHELFCVNPSERGFSHSQGGARHF